MVLLRMGEGPAAPQVPALPPRHVGQAPAGFLALQYLEGGTMGGLSRDIGGAGWGEHRGSEGLRWKTGQGPGGQNSGRPGRWHRAGKQEPAF